MTSKKIYEEYRQSLYLEALSIVKNPEDAEDIVEYTFLKVADNFTEISQKNRQKMRAYIVIINRNNAIDRYNKNKKDLEKKDDTPLEEIVDTGYFDSFEYDDQYRCKTCCLHCRDHTYRFIYNCYERGVIQRGF